MKQTATPPLAAGLLLVLVIGPLTHIAAPVSAGVPLTIDLAGEGYRFEGWGTSLCWWANGVGGWRDDSLEPLLDAIVDPVEGLGLTVFRYNIGGGDDPAHQHLRRFADLPGFQTAPDAPIDPDADPLQRRVLLKLIERADAPILEAFSNSPPYWMTRSGCVSGASDGGPNLSDERIVDFAAYLADVLQAYRDHHGVTFRTIDPFNEPNETWWKAGGSQEGCQIPEAQQSELIVALRDALAERGLASSTAIAATDAHDLDLTLRNAQRLTPAALAAVGQINTHTYRGAHRRELREFADEHGKRLWQSESGPMGLRGRGERVALRMMQRVALDLNDLHAAAWVMWQVVDPSPAWSCFKVDNERQTFEPTPNFALYRQFTRSLRPGDLVVPTSTPDLVAVVSSAGDRVTFVAVNAGSAAKDYDLRLVGGVVSGASAVASRSTLAASDSPVEGVVVEVGAIRFVAEPGSVTTVTASLVP